MLRVPVPRARRQWLFLLACSILIPVLLAAFEHHPPARAAADRPNILLIVSDDQRYDTMDYMPRTRELIFDRGVEFTRAYITTPRCCPSRSSILTGMYAHQHNVRTNDDHLRKPTFVQMLHESGYQTALVGKYLNSYPKPEKGDPLPEFDLWAAMADGLTRYNNTPLFVNDQWVENKGYQTDILLHYANQFFGQAAQEDRPFFLLFTPYTPHLPATPAPEDADLYADLAPYDAPSFNPADLAGKPAWLQALPLLTPEQIATIQSQRLAQLRSLNALDRTVAALIAELDRLGELDNTLVFYLSDNGFMWGEHRIETGKVQVYEESVRVPFAVYYPPLIAAPRVDDHLIANIDIAPTILDAAGIPLPADMDGRSLLPLLRDPGDVDWHDHLLLEGWPVGLDELGNLPNWLAIHTGDLVYVETEGDRSELYDLNADPYQLDNHIDDPAYQAERERLAAILKAETKGVNPPPLTSRANRVNFAFVEWATPGLRWFDGFWYTYRYSRKLWGSVILLIGLGVAFWQRRAIRARWKAWRAGRE